MVYQQHWTYDALPKEIFGEKILEIGVHAGKVQLNSKYADFFVSDGYLGIDRVKVPSILNVLEIDILDFQTTQKFDLILSVQTLCYIAYPDWKPLFDKLVSFLNPNGYLVFIIDYKMGTDNTFRMRVNEDNKTYPVIFMNITRKCFTNILPFEIKIIKNWMFREEGEPIFRSIIRFMYRLVTRHPRVPRRKILAIWKKIGG